MAYNITRINSPSTIKRVLFILIIIVCLITIQNLIRSIYDLWNKQDLVVKAKKELEKQQRENRQLKAKITHVKSDEFIEEEARNNLFMVKPGESGVIVPSEFIKKRKIKKEPSLPNWQKWVNLFISGKN